MNVSLSEVPGLDSLLQKAENLVTSMKSAHAMRNTGHPRVHTGQTATLSIVVTPVP